MFWRTEPWGPKRDNMHAGIVAAALANSFRGKKQQPVTHQDFMFMTADEAAAHRTDKMKNWFFSVAKKKKSKKT